MILTDIQSNTFYDMLYDWISIHTSGEPRGISSLKYYQKRVWSPVSNAIFDISQKTELSIEEQDFLKYVVYNGRLFRLQNYHPKYKGYIFENDNFQSWSRNVNGLTKVSNLTGQVLLIVAKAQGGIDVFGLLTFLLKYRYITWFDEFKSPRNLLRYEEEQEVVYPMAIDSINVLKAIEKEKLTEWATQGIDIPRTEWRRNTFL